jgi:hypothetical protein
MYFPLIPGRTEELIRSTCGGVYAHDPAGF